MTTIINGSSPSITFSDSTTQTTAFTSTPSITTITTSSDASISGLTVGKGGGSVSTNTAVGAGVFAANTTGSSNTAIGYQAFQGGTTASNNTAVGYQASFNTTGNGNSSYGVQAFYTNTTGVADVAIGQSALFANTTGSYNTALGRESLYSNTTASNNTAVGYQALYAVTTATNYTAIGYQAGLNQTSGGDATYVGWQAGADVTTGANNICLGSFSGRYTTGIVTGSQNIMIGAYTGASSTSANYQICIGYAAVAKGANTGFINSLSTYNGANSSSWSTTSDRRLKKNIVDNTEGLDKIVQIRVRNFEYRTAEEVTELPAHTVIDKQGVQLGVIAQELREVCPDCVKEESTGVISVDSDNIFWHMVNAIKDLKALVDAQSARIATLESR